VEDNATDRIALHVWLAAQMISSTLFLIAGGLLAGLALIGSLQAGPGTAPEIGQEVADWEIRAMFFGGASLIFSVSFTIIGIVGLNKVKTAYESIRN